MKNNDIRDVSCFKGEKVRTRGELKSFVVANDYLNK